jgi:glutamate racemase
VTLVGASRLARLAEAHLKGEPVSDADVLAEIAPCFREKEGLRTDAVALACTHYPLLLDAYRRVAPWEVHWIDPAPAIARRVRALLMEDNELARRFNDLARGVRPQPQAAGDAAFFTSGKPAEPALARALSASGLHAAAGFDLAFP